MLPVLLALASVGATAQTPREKTNFQTAAQWKPATDIRADAVMVYGPGDIQGYTFRQRVDSWRDKGYLAQYMTGIAWGEYQEYFTGKWDGLWHLDEGQKTSRGDTIFHGYMVPYIVPSQRYIRYFCERALRPALDAGISGIFLEEPEFWNRSGYSEAFKREWQQYYGFPWRAQNDSPENTYLSNKLKYHLYYRALDSAFTYAKSYGRQKGLDVKCYVATHSLLNYAAWSIVSPEASLASLAGCDGYIAQVWTGTSREPTFYNGRERERVFENAFLEYGCMESMVRPTRRKLYFLTDPVEDWPRDWADYKRNYQATFTAQLLWPRVDSYEVMPWPDRIYEGLFNESARSDKKIHIPRFYSTQMQVMINALGDIPATTNAVSGSHGVSVAMANSLMFQRADTSFAGYSDPRLSNTYGLALPMVKRGVPVSILHLENAGLREAWQGTRVLLLSYSNLKPMSADVNRQIAQWVKCGGALVYSSRDDDPFQRVMEWWNQRGNDYAAPSEHLFELMGMPRRAPEGEYRYGRGRVYVLRHDPKEYVMQSGGDSLLVSTVERAYHPSRRSPRLQMKNSLVLRRGPYVVAAVVDESPAGNAPVELRGRYIDLFQPSLPMLSGKSLSPGEQALLYDLSSVRRLRHPKVLAAASRQSDEQTGRRSYSFTAKSPANTTNRMCIWLPRRGATPKVTAPADGANPAAMVEAKGTRAPLYGGELLWLEFENSPQGVRVELTW